MGKPLHQFFVEDHLSIDQLLTKALKQGDEIDLESYRQFRIKLLTHIKMEEKILFPSAKKANHAVMQELLPQFRLEHGALTALMVPPPSTTLIKVIRYVLENHNIKEEIQEGLYDVCETLTQGQTRELLDQLTDVEEVPVHPPNPAPIAMEAAKRALQRAGYDFDEIVRHLNGENNNVHKAGGTNDDFMN